jgi:hypothetical protein
MVVRSRFGEEQRAENREKNLAFSLVIKKLQKINKINSLRLRA